MKGSSLGKPECEHPLAVKEGRLEPKTPEFKAETGGSIMFTSWRLWSDTELTAATAKHLPAVSAGLHHISIIDRKPNSSTPLLTQTAATSNEPLVPWLKNCLFHESDHLIGGLRGRGTRVTGLFLFFHLICPKRSQEWVFLCWCDAARLQTVSVKERKCGWVIHVNIIHLESEPIRHRPRIIPNWPFGINVKKSFGKMRTGNKSVGAH